MKKIIFKRGIYNLNQEPNFDFQLNRIIMWNGGRIEDIEPIASRITNSQTWKKELISLGDVAIAENRIENAIAYYRMSEFFMYDGDEEKLKYYRKATSLFYEYYSDYFTSGTVERIEVPYEDEVNITRCGMRTLAKDFDALGMFPAVCRVDYLMFSIMGGGFQRNKTLGDGDSCCNCIYTIGGKCDWNPEKGFKNRK